MKIGMKFNNTYSANIGVYISNIKRPALPVLRKKKVVIAGKHGAFDFGGNIYEERIITVDCFIKEKSYEDVRQKARDIAVWLGSKGQLIFDDEPDKYYIAQTYSSIEPEQIIKSGKFTVTFECDPFAYSITSTSDDAIWDSDVTWNSDVTWGGSDNYTFPVTSSPTSLQIYNFGTMPVRPIISVIGSFATINISINGLTIGYSEAVIEGTIIINNVKYTVTKDGVNKLSVTTGDTAYFLELAPGINNITISGTGLNCTVLFDFRPLYL